MKIKVEEIINAIDGKLLTSTSEIENVFVEGGYASDLLSDVMGNAKKK